MCVCVCVYKKINLIDFSVPLLPLKFLPCYSDESKIGGNLRNLRKYIITIIIIIFISVSFFLFFFYENCEPHPPVTISITFQFLILSHLLPA